MNREIKFRAWDKETKQMHSHDDFDTFDKDGVMMWGDVFSGKDDTIELMQFTGLHDKNGKEIYEGDIDQYRCLCYFYNGCFVFGKKGNPTFIPLYDANNIEIVGNIFENPELMEETKNGK